VTSVKSAENLGSAAQQDRRRRILDATIALASEGGFDAVQMREVADRADVALGTLYRYFPSKIHLLVSALAGRFEAADAALRGRPVPGDTEAERVIGVLRRVTRGLQGDEKLTEALTRAFMFADSSVQTEIDRVGMLLTSMLTRAMRPEADPRPDPGSEGVTAEDVQVARVIGDVWLSTLMTWVTGRSSAAETAEHMEYAVRLILR
jgi:AcrR family transcriptional regulator